MGRRKIRRRKVIALKAVTKYSKIAPISHIKVTNLNYIRTTSNHQLSLHVQTRELVIFNGSVVSRPTPVDRLVVGLFYPRIHPQYTSTHEVCIPLDLLTTGAPRR